MCPSSLKQSPFPTLLCPVVTCDLLVHCTNFHTGIIKVFVLLHRGNSDHHDAIKRTNELEISLDLTQHVVFIMDIMYMLAGVGCLKGNRF